MRQIFFSCHEMEFIEALHSTVLNWLIQNALVCKYPIGENLKFGLIFQKPKTKILRWIFDYRRYEL